MSYLVPASANQLGEQSSSLTNAAGGGVAKTPLAVVRGPGSRGGKGFFRVVTKGKFKGQVLYCYGTYTQIHDSLELLKKTHHDPSNPVDSDVFDQFIGELGKNKEQSGDEASSEDIEGTGPLVDHAEASLQDGADPADGTAIVRVFGHPFTMGDSVNSFYYPSEKAVAPGNAEDLLSLIGGLTVGVDHENGQPFFSDNAGQLGISGLVAAIQSHIPKKDVSGNHHITHEFAMMVLQNLQSLMINAHSSNTNTIRNTLSRLAQTIRREFPESDFDLNAQAALNTQAEVWMQHGNNIIQLNENNQGHLDQTEKGEGWDTKPDSPTRDVEDLGLTPAPDEYVQEASRPKMPSNDNDGHGSEIGDTESLKEQAARVFELVKSRANQILQKYFSGSQTDSYQKQEVNDVIRNFLFPQSTDGKERDQYEQAQQLLLGKQGSTSTVSVRISGSGSVQVVPATGVSAGLSDQKVVATFTFGKLRDLQGSFDIADWSDDIGSPRNRALSVLNAMAYTLGITPDGIWKAVFRSISDTGASVNQNIIDTLSEHFLLYNAKDASGPSLSNISEDSHSRITEQAATLIVELTRMNSEDFSKIESNPQVGNKNYKPYIDMVAKWRKIYKGVAGIVDENISYFNKDQILKKEVKGGFAIDDPNVRALTNLTTAPLVSIHAQLPEFPAHLVASAKTAGFLSTLQTLTDRILFFETLKANLTTGGAYYSGEKTVTGDGAADEYQTKIDIIKEQFEPLLKALETHFSENKQAIADVNYALIKRLGLFGKGAIQVQDPELMLSDGINTERLGSRVENPAFDGNMQISRWNKKIPAVNADSSNLIADPLALSVKDKINFENWNLDFFKQMISSSSRPVVSGQTKGGFVSGDVSGQSAPVIITLEHIAKAMMNEQLPTDEDEYPVIGENSDSNPFNVRGSLRKIIDVLKERYTQDKLMPMQEFMNLLTNNGKSKLQGIQHEDIESIVQKTVLQAQECKRLGISPVPITSISGYLPEMGSVSQDPASRRDEIYGRGSITSASAPLVYFLGGNGHVLQAANRIAFYDDPILNVDELEKDILGFFSYNQSKVSREIEIQSGESQTQSRTEYTSEFKSAMTTFFSQLKLYGIDTGTTFSDTSGHLDLNHITGNGKFKPTEKGNTALGREQLIPFFNQLRTKVEERIKEISEAAESLHYQAIEAPISILVSENPYISEKNNGIDNSGKYFMQSDKLLAQKISEFAKSKKEPMNVGVIVIPALERYLGVQMHNLPTSQSRDTAILTYVARLNDHEKLQISPQLYDTTSSASVGTPDMAQNLQNPDAPARVITVHDAEYPTLLKMDGAKTSGPEVLFTSKKDNSGKLSKIFGSTMRVLVRQVSKDNLQDFLDSDAAKGKSVVIERSELDRILGIKFPDISEFFKRNSKTNFIIVGSPDDSLSLFSNCATVSAHPRNFFSSSNPDSKTRLNDNAQLALRLSAGCIGSSNQPINSDIPQISWDKISTNDGSFSPFAEEMAERAKNNEFTKVGNDRSVSWQEFFLNSNPDTIGGIDNSGGNVCLLSPHAPSIDHAEFQQTDASYKIPNISTNTSGGNAVVSPPESDLDEIDPVQTYTISSSLDQITKNGGLSVRSGRERLPRFLTRLSLQRGMMLSENIKKALGFSGIVGHVSANSLQSKMASEFADTQKRLFVLQPSWLGADDSEKAVLDRENPAGSVIDVTGRAPSASDRFDPASLARIQSRCQPVSMRSILRASNVYEVSVAGLNDDEAMVVEAIHALINSYVQSLNHDIKHGRVTSTVKKVGRDDVLVAPHKRDKKSLAEFNFWYGGSDADGWVYKYNPDEILTAARGAGNLPIGLMKFLGNLDPKLRSAYLAYRAASKAHSTKEKSSPLYPADSRTGNWALLRGKSLHRDRDVPIASFGSSSSSGIDGQERFAFQAPGAVPVNTEYYDDITPDAASRRNIVGIGSWADLGDNEQRLGQLSQAINLDKFLGTEQVDFSPLKSLLKIGTGQDAHRWSLIKRMDNTPETHMRIQSNLFPDIRAEATYQHATRENQPYSTGRVRLYSSSSDVPLMDIPMEHFLKDHQGLLDPNHAVNTARLHYLTFDRMLIDLAARMISSYSTAKLQEMYKDILEGKKSRVQDTVFPPNTWPTLDGGSHGTGTRSGLWNVVQTPDRSILERTPASGSRIFPTVGEKIPKVESLEDLLSRRNAPQGQSSLVNITNLIKNWIFSQYRALSAIQAPATVSSAPTVQPLAMVRPPAPHRVERPVSSGSMAELAPSTTMENIPSWNDPDLIGRVSSLLEHKNHENIIYGMDETGRVTQEYIYNPNSPQYDSIHGFYAHVYKDMHATVNNDRHNLQKIAEQLRVRRFDSFAIDHFNRPANLAYDKTVKKMRLLVRQTLPENAIPISDKAIEISKKLIENWKSKNQTMFNAGHRDSVVDITPDQAAAESLLRELSRKPGKRSSYLLDEDGNISQAGMGEFLGRGREKQKRAFEKIREEIIQSLRTMLSPIQADTTEGDEDLPDPLERSMQAKQQWPFVYFKKKVAWT